jgi:hypothetical protein
MTSIPWPWARIAPQQRAFLWLAILLISASGLITGLAVHSLAHGPHASSTPIGIGTTTGTDTPAAGTVTVTTAPAVTTPQQFAILLSADTPAAHGTTMTVVAHAVVAEHFDGSGLPVGNTRPAQGVTCQITITPAGGITLPTAQKTDVSGTASFAVTIPATTPPGTYIIHVHATWTPGGFAADRNLSIKIT